MRADEVEIEAPCDEDWDAMRLEPGGRRRWCEHCERRVHDLSAMDEPAARAFLRASADRDVCIAYFEDERGEIVFAPDATIVPLARVRRRSPRVEAAQLVSAASLALLLGACTPHGEVEPLQVDAGRESATMLVPASVIPAQDGPRSGPGLEPTELEPCEPETRAPEPPPPRLVKKGKRKTGTRISRADTSVLDGL